VAIASALILGYWGYNRRQEAQNEDRLKAEVQTILDLQHKAYLEGDGDLFFASQDDDPGWFSAQLLPENQAANRAGLQVTEVQEWGENIWANVSWINDGQTRQRVAFFQRRGNRLKTVPTAEDFWGDLQRLRHPWGWLIIHKIDQKWATEISTQIDRRVSETCATALTGYCLESSLPFTMTIAQNFAVSASPNELHLPSPRLLALDDQGEPSELFWDRLDQILEAHLTPAHIRFAVPEDPVLLGVDVKYRQLAAEFSAANPDITVEIINLNELPNSPQEWLAEVDGAALTPTQDMLTAGLVYDLTDFVNSDPDFDKTDFYEQIWQGSWWRGRMWFLPQTARMNLLFYDKEAYQQAELDEPSLRWTWEEMNQHIDTLSASLPEHSRSSRKFIFMDTSREALFSYAYNWNNNCPETAPIRCQRRLQPVDVAAALDWYRQLAAKPGVMPDLTGLSPSERERMMFNFQASIWVDSPVRYEFRLLMNPVGVVPFPGSDRFDGITPLWVDGNIISQRSQQPQATWQWLKFLSYQHLQRRLRLIPARPSVAAQSGYWNTLPRPLGDAMRTAFPFTHPVFLEAQDHFSWSQLADVVSDHQSPAEAAQSAIHVRWFGQ
jgi:ABC-type glycerol-3-phosphate transport system substrate-binding protein